MTRALLLAAAALACAGAAHAQEQTFKVSNTTPNCRDGSRTTHQVCLPEGKRVKAPAAVRTVSQGGKRATIVSQNPAPGRPDCWQIVTEVLPLGEDCLKVPFVQQTGVCTCKGRGWIELEVKLVPE